VRHSGCVGLAEEVLIGLDAAFNESQVAGLHVDHARRRVRLLLHVLALPVDGPVDRDTRHAVVLSGVSDVHVLVRAQLDAGRYGPPIQLRDFAGLDRFFQSLTFQHPMYGWKFLDDPQLTQDWPPDVSLSTRLSDRGAAHQLYWFTECGGEEPDAAGAYCIEGTVQFDDLAVQRADGTDIPVEDFIAAARRWWTALHADDPRVSVEAQHASWPPPPWTP
jgi:hypothetical protein